MVQASLLCCQATVGPGPCIGLVVVLGPRGAFDGRAAWAPSNMAGFLNNNSALILLILLVLVVGLFAWEHRRSKRGLAVIAAIVVVLGAGYATARSGPSDVATLAEVDVVLAGGAPVVMEIYSDF